MTEIYLSNHVIEIQKWGYMSLCKGIFIQNNCFYTRNGIELLINELKNDGLSVNVTANVATLNATDYQILHKQHASIFILGLKKNNDDYGDFFYFILEWLPMHYPKAKVIIMANAQAIGQLKNYLLGLGNVIAVLDESIKMPELKLCLKKIIIEKVSVIRDEKKVPLLTRQEIKVLVYLLKGTPTSQVAKTLGITHKTVSNHKCNALGKMGYVSLKKLMSSEGGFSTI